MLIPSIYTLSTTLTLGKKKREKRIEGLCYYIHDLKTYASFIFIIIKIFY